jgi:hypothetical protein
MLYLLKGGEGLELFTNVCFLYISFFHGKGGRTEAIRAKFKVPDWEIYCSRLWRGLPYGPANQCSLHGQYDNHMPESTIRPVRGSMNLTTGSHGLTHRSNLRFSYKIRRFSKEIV